MSKYINEEQLKSDTLEMTVADLEDKTEELAGRLFVMQMKLSNGGSYDEVVKFCEVLLQIKAIETFCDEITAREKSL